MARSSTGMTITGTLLAVLLLVLIVGGIYVYSGAYNVAADDDLEPLTRWLFSTVTSQSIAHHADPLDPPLNITEALVTSGARRYAKMCVDCHGGPGVESEWMGEHMVPKPPDLEHVGEEHTPAFIYWVIKHGIKHSGMPSMPEGKEQAIRELTAFVKRMHTVSADSFRAMTRSDTTMAAPASSS